MACFRFHFETSEFNKTISAVFEGIFLIYSMIQFFIDDNSDINTNEPKKAFKETSMSYLKGNFIYDIIPLMPL